MNRRELGDHRTAVEDLLCDLDPPDEAVARVVAASLTAESARSPGHRVLGRSLLLLLVALALLAIPTVLLRRSAQEPAGDSRALSEPAEGPGFSLSNREGLLVLRSPTGQYLAVFGGHDE